MAEAVAAGAREVADTEAILYQVPELASEERLTKSGARSIREKFAHVPFIQPLKLIEADAIIFGTPSHFGNMCAQMHSFLDDTLGLWYSGALVGRIGSVFTSAATQHGGIETTITSFHNILLHHGMIIVGIPYTEQRLLAIDRVMGGSPYGASTITGGHGSRQPSDDEFAIARFQGRHVAQIARRMKLGIMAETEQGK